MTSIKGICTPRRNNYEKSPERSTRRVKPNTQVDLRLDNCAIELVAMSWDEDGVRQTNMPQQFKGM